MPVAGAICVQVTQRATFTAQIQLTVGRKYQAGVRLAEFDVRKYGTSPNIHDPCAWSAEDRKLC